MIGTFELLVAMICVGVEVLLAVGVDVGPGEEVLELINGHENPLKAHPENDVRRT